MRPTAPTTTPGSSRTITCSTCSTALTPLRPAPRSPTTPQRCTHSAWCSRTPPRLRSLATPPDHLFGALGVDTVAWEALDRGTVNGGSGIALRARDLLKFGQLFLQRGRSGDASVVPESWVDSVTRPQFAWRTTVGPLQRVTYGMLWWVSDADPAAFFAWGYGGQFVYVVPSKDIVVVATTDWVQLTEITPMELAAQVLGVVVGDVVPAAR